MLVPPEKFGMVEESLYRCSELMSLHVGFLSTLKLRSVLWLDREHPSRQLDTYFHSQSISIHYLTAETGEDDDNDGTVDRRAIAAARALELVLDVRNSPCLIVDPSGIIVALLRKVSGWNYASICSEYRRMAEKASYDVETMIEVVDVKLTAPTSHEIETTDANETPAKTNSKSIDLPVYPSSSPQIPKSLLNKVQRRRVQAKNTHVTLPSPSFQTNWCPQVSEKILAFPPSLNVEVVTKKE